MLGTILPLETVFAALKTALRRDGRWIVAGTITALLLGTGIAVLGHRVGGRAGYFYSEFRSEGEFSGLMTAVSAFLLGAAGVLLAMVSRGMRRFSGGAGARVWLLSGAGLLFLGADELLGIHERAAYLLTTIGVPTPLGLPPDIYVFAAYAVVAVLVLPYLIRSSLAAPTAVLLLLLAMVAFGGSQLVDLFVPWEELSPAQQSVAGPAEELLKVIGSVYVFGFAAIVLESRDRGFAPSSS